MSATPRPRIHTLLGIKQAGVAKRIVVWDTETIEIGRAPENDLVLDDEELSRRHATLRRGVADHFVLDHGTANGTFVNGTRLCEEHALRSKDVIRLGTTELTFVKSQRNPSALKLPVDYASELKNFGHRPPADSLESTTLGLGDALTPESSSFNVGGVGSFAPEGSAATPRNLDVELEGARSDPGARLSLTLEIDGLSLGLRETLQALLGKEIDLPPLRIRIKADEL